MSQEEELQWAKGRDLGFVGSTPTACTISWVALCVNSRSIRVERCTWQMTRIDQDMMGGQLLQPALIKDLYLINSLA